MSASSFHQRFKAVTSMSPLQYQKVLRLHEARRLMLFQRMDASDACPLRAPSRTTQPGAALNVHPSPANVTSSRRDGCRHTTGAAIGRNQHAFLRIERPPRA